MPKENQGSAADLAALDEDAIWSELDGQDAAPAAAPEAEPEPEIEPEVDTPEPAVAAEAPPPDPWATAPEPLRNDYAKLQRELEDLRQRQRSEEGRVSAYQRKYEELRSQLDKDAEAAVAPPASDKSKDEPKPDDLDADLAELADAYPEIGGTVKKLFDAVRQETVKLSAAQQSVLERHYQREEAALAEAHPDWREVVTGNNQPVFALWLQRQPEDVQRAAQANGYTIEDSRAASRVIGAFKEFLSAQSNPAPPPAQPPEQKPQPQSSKRARQLAGAETVRARGQQAFTPGIPEDAPEADIWDAIEREETSRRRTAS